MPTATTKKRARAKKRQGKAPTTQAGEFVREQMHKKKRGRGAAKSRRQAIAIGLSEARRSGINVGQPRSKRQTKGKTKRTKASSSRSRRSSSSSKRSSSSKSSRSRSRMKS